MSTTTGVVITGIGPVCPLGIGREAVCAALDAGRSGLRRVDELVAAGRPGAAAVARDLYLLAEPTARL